MKTNVWISMIVKLMISISIVVFISSITNAQESVVSKKSKVSFTGRLHAQAQTSNAEAADNMNNSFSIRRARLTAKFKNLTGTMEGKVQFDLGEGGYKLKDGYVELKFNSKYNVKLGQFKKPFSLWELTSSTKTMVIERGNKLLGSGWKSTNNIIVKDGLYAGRDIGLMMHGKMNKLKYSVGVFNGNGYNKKKDDDNGKLIGGRAVFSASKTLAVGAAFSNRTVSEYNSFIDTLKNGNSASFQAFGIDMDYGIKHKVSKNGLWVQAEFLTGANPNYSDEAKFMGLTFLASYNLKKAEGGAIYSIRPALRIDYSQRNTDDDDTGSILLTPGLDIFFDEFNRLQINLDIVKPQMDGADTEMGIRFQLQMHI